SSIHLFHVPFSLQIHNLPIGFKAQEVGQSIGNFVGKFLEYNDRNNTHIYHPFIHIRVLLDVRKSLKKSKKIRKPGGESNEVLFKFKRLGKFCYLCGILGHLDDSYGKLLMMGEDDGTHQ
ncbi:hypothetical protein D0Y65_042080, partial [Glycine soja]